MKYNNKYYELFSDEKDKAVAFDSVAEIFFDKNFSSATKSEIELLLFSIYMDATIKCRKLDDGTIDYAQTSDYEIGKELGIPQEKVRSLKIKKQARYPVEFDWRKSLTSVKDNVRYDKERNKIMIPTRDPNLYNEIRNFIEDHGGYIEVQRSGNVIQIRPEYYFMLIYEDLDEDGKKKCRKDMAETLRKHNRENEIKEAVTHIEVLKCAGKIAKLGIDVLFSINEMSDNPLFEVLRAISKNL